MGLVLLLMFVDAKKDILVQCVMYIIAMDYNPMFRMYVAALVLALLQIIVHANQITMELHVPNLIVMVSISITLFHVQGMEIV